MKDIHNDFAHAVVLAPAVRTASATGATVDRQGFESVEFVAHVGVGGITFTGTNKLELVMEHSDDGSAWSACAGADVLGETQTVASGVVHAITAEHAAAAVYNFGYVGGKRYCRLSDTRGGTHATGTATAIAAVKGHAKATPGVTTAIAG